MNQNQFVAAAIILQNPEALVKRFQSPKIQEDDLNALISVLNDLEDNQIEIITVSVMEVLCEKDSSLKELFENQKEVHSKETNYKSPSPDDIANYLQMVKENWQGIAILVLALRGLGHFRIEASSTIGDILGFLLKKKDKQPPEEK